MILAILFLFIQLGFAVFMLYSIIAFLTGAPFVPSTNPAAGAMIDLSDIKRGDRVYDLGSGNGKLLLLAAKKGAMTTGYEINPILVIFSTIRGLVSPYRKQVKTVWRNFWSADVRDADIVYVYLLPFRMEKLERKLKKELKKGTLVVSNSFIFPHWKILRQDPQNHIYVFHI